MLGESTAAESHRPEISVVVPVLNEERAVAALYARVSAVLRGLVASYEFVFVDDGSTDRTPLVLAELSALDPAVSVVQLSRNFGHQAALLAGLDHACGRAVIMMDADLQHPPEILPEMVRRWREGYHVVYTIRREDPASGLFKRATRWLFYSLFRRMARVDMESDAADFRLLDARVVHALRQFRERFLFFRGLVGWVGFRRVAVDYVGQARVAGRSKYTVGRMLRLALDGLFSFSTLPLQLAIWLGLAVALVGAGYAGFALWAALVLRATVPGWTSLMIVVLLLGGVQLVVLGILGAYLGRAYEEVKGRPVYVVQEVRRGGQARAPDADHLPGM
ncbi:MAG: glycosyltransferase family 2 protein [Candidatus Binatia bacterium]